MTLPHLRTYAELAILLGTVLMVQVFDPVNIMTKGAGNTKTLAYLLYERAFIGQQIGEAAAYGVITVIVTIVIATLALRKPCSRCSPRRRADGNRTVESSRPPLRPGHERQHQFTQRKVGGYLVTAADLGAGVHLHLPRCCG